MVPDTEAALIYLLSQPRPHLILLDMLFPPGSSDGWAFFEERKRNPPLAAIPVVIVTGISAASDEWANSLGAVACLQIPIDAEDLLQVVSRHLGMSGSHRPV